MIKDALDAYANSLTKTWSHDRSKTVGASEIGQCARKTWYGKHADSPRDPDYADSYGARLRGTITEDHFWYPAMRAHFGDALLYAGPNQQTFVSGYLSATPDGLVSGEDCFTLESKTADPRTNLASPKYEHVYQCQVQLGLLRETTEHRPSRAVLSYTNASFWNECVEFTITFDPKIYQVAKDRATLIMTAGAASELKPDGWISGGRECEHCAYTKACGIARRSVPDDANAAQPIDVQFTAEITDLARSIRSLERVGETNDARLREAQQAIRDRLREKGIRRIPGVVSWASVKGRKTYDHARLREAATEAGVDIETYSKVGEDSDRLTITAGKEEAA